MVAHGEQYVNKLPINRWGVMLPCVLIHSPPKTTVAKTTAAPITELSGILELDVTDVEEFQRNVKVVSIWPTGPEAC